MPRILHDELAEPVLATLLGACAVDDGPTDVQRELLRALADGFFHHPVDLDGLRPLGPDESAATFTAEAERRRVRDLVVLAELCRRPLTEAQVERTAAYVQALGGDDDALALARDLVADGVARAREDFMRLFGGVEPTLREPSLAGAAGSAPVEEDEALAARLRALRDCPPGSLGRAYVAFYDDNGFPLPGEAAQPAAVFVAHDMTHVIAGYGPTGVEEIALGAMQLGMDDSDAHWVQFLGNLGVHEVGFVVDGVTPGVLDHPGAMATVAHGFDRGVRCGADFSLADHLSMVDEPLEQVRERFGVPPREC